MNLFEKIFNYQILTRLDESGAYMLTSHERVWLKTMLAHPAAGEAFEPETLRKLLLILQEEECMNTADCLQEKAKSVERQVYHPHLRLLRGILAGQQGVCLTYTVKDGSVRRNQAGFPHKLEYSMVKREWYLLWYHLRNKRFMSTRLQSILSLEETALPDKQAEELNAKLLEIGLEHKEQAVLEVTKLYNAELSRILYAFSCFDKEVGYDPEADIYSITLTYPKDESEYVLSKIRFLGKRVRVVDNGKLQSRMRETASKALARYGETEA
jgi:predicted DNA-binding transcriptional regulator YafY